MIQDFEQHVQALVTCQFFVVFAIGFFCFGEIAELLCRLLHALTIDLAANLSERIYFVTM
jgi:hypothetical protein